MDALGCLDAERQAKLPDVKKEKSAVTSGVREAVGVLVDSVKRSGWVPSSVGRYETGYDGRGVAREDRA